MEVLTLNGKRYVKASKAAKELGYASDYVGQLCRSGVVDAHLVGRTWYVNPDTLGAHRVEKKRNARVKAREYARKSIEETRSLAVKQNTKSFKNIAIRYEGDQKELIPEVKKVHIASEMQLAPQEDPDFEEAGYVIENADKKIIMSGKVPVFDAEEETVLTDTTILTPRIIRTKHKTEVSLKPLDAALEEIDEEKRDMPIDKPRSFAEKLAAQAVEATEETSAENNSALIKTEATVSTIPIQKAASSKPMQQGSGIGAILISVLVIILSIATLYVTQTFTYTEGNVKGGYAVDAKSVNDFMLQYIDFLARR